MRWACSIGYTKFSEHERLSEKELRENLDTGRIKWSVQKKRFYRQVMHLANVDRIKKLLTIQVKGINQKPNKEDIGQSMKDWIHEAGKHKQDDKWQDAELEKICPIHA